MQPNLQFGSKNETLDLGGNTDILPRKKRHLSQLSIVPDNNNDRGGTVENGEQDDKPQEAPMT